MSSKKGSTSKLESNKSNENTDDDLLGVAIDIVSGIYGEEARILLNYIVRNGYVAEETLSNDIGIKSNEGRKILQKMSEEAIVVPDKLRTENGVLHIWRLNKPALKSFLLNRLKKARDNLDILLKYGLENFLYECPKCKRVFTPDTAYTSDYTCPHDGETLVELDINNSVSTIEKLVRRLNNIISKLERVSLA